MLVSSNQRLENLHQLRSKNKDKLAWRDENNVSEWNDKSTSGLLYQ
jgi:hypothetical protein